MKQYSKKEAVKMFRLGTPMKEIADVLSVPVSTISTVLRAHYKTERIKKSLLLADRMFIEAVAKEFQKGASLKELSNKFHIGVRTAMRILRVKDQNITFDPPDRIAEMIRRLENGETLESIGNRFNITREAVRQQTTLYIGRKRHKALIIKSANARTESNTVEVIKLAKQGAIAQEIAQQLSWPRTKIIRLARRGFSQPEYIEWTAKNLRAGQASRRGRLEIDKKHQAIVNLRTQGLTHKAIADQIGCSTVNVIAVCKKKLSEQQMRAIRIKTKRYGNKKAKDLLQ